MSADNSQVDPRAGVPDTIVDLAQSLRDFVERAVGIRPDFTPETLPLVDYYLKEARQAVANRPEVIDLTAQAIGAYFGEVVRRALTGFWVLPSPNFHDWLVCGEAAYLAFNPIGVGYEVLTLGTTHHGPTSQLKLLNEDREHIAARLASLPEETEEVYFTLSARFDGLQIVYDAVRAQAEQRGYGETSYDPADYGAEPDRDVN